VRPRPLGPHGDRLISWYRQQKRDLPWRQSKDPYRILVSEVMLQQTRVAAVLPYFERFVRQFPSFQALASASLDDVLKAWQGLGYYRRAQYLHEAAKIVAREYQGQLPNQPEMLASLPGVGPYTAAALASIVFGHPEPVLDGNSVRVLCRFFGIRGKPSLAQNRRRLRNLARHLMGRNSPGDFNQAMMELGAVVCTPRKPRCPDCPLVVACRAYQTQEVDLIPNRSRSRNLPHFHVAAGIIWNDGRILIAQRLPDGMLANLWEFPGGKPEAGENLEECVIREIREELQIEVAVCCPFVAVEHAYSHFRITLHTYHCVHRGGEPKPVGCQRFAWVRPIELLRFPLPAASLRVAERLLQSPIPTCLTELAR